MMYPEWEATKKTGAKHIAPRLNLTLNGVWFGHWFGDRRWHPTQQSVSNALHATSAPSASKTTTTYRRPTWLLLGNSCFPWTTRTSAQTSGTKTKVENTSPVSARAARLAWFCPLSMAELILEWMLQTITSDRMMIHSKMTALREANSLVNMPPYTFICSSSQTADPSESSSILISSGLFTFA